MKTYEMKGSAGKCGNNVRSDCFVEIELTKSKGIKSSLQSKVNSMYGQDINDMIIMMCDIFEIKHGEILVEDNGALPFAFAARFETAYKKISPDDSREFFSSMNKNNYYPTQKDRMRRSRLYLPGNEPKFYPNAGLHKPDGIILDLEDSVAPSEKEAVRYQDNLI